MEASIKYDVAIAPLTSFKIGGVAECLVDVATEDELAEALSWCQEKKLEPFILAGGSNVVVPDSGISGCVIRLLEGTHNIRGTEIVSFAGCDLQQLINKSAVVGLTGWEHMAGIPGTLGGAVRGNAGAFGTEIKDVIECVEVLHKVSLEKKIFSNAECEFAYRNSFFKQNPEWVIISATINLQKGDAEKCQSTIKETIRKREEKHIQNIKSVGSFFINPVAPKEVVAEFEREKGVQTREGRVPAGWLIDRSNMKGVKVGGVKSSEHQANYFVNVGNATAEDVKALAKLIKQNVYEKYGINLQEEPTVVGLYGRV